MSRFFFHLDGGDSLDYLSVIYFTFRIGPGIGVEVDQEPRVGVGTVIEMASSRIVAERNAPHEKRIRLGQPKDNVCA